jgi:hypothetical protein
MGLLQRRVAFLADQYKHGKLKISKELSETKRGKKLRKELSQVRLLPDGTVNLSTCSPFVRSMAKAIYSLRRLHQPGAPESDHRDSEKITTEAISSVMREYFELPDEFFVAATGTKPEKFASRGSFGDRIHQEAKRLATRGERAWQTYVPRIGEFHAKYTRLLLGSSKAIGGLKYVMGGSSRFPKDAFDGFRKFALYADTIFIPDPVLAWIEVERTDERFPRVSLLEACHDLLRLKPLVDAELPYPALVVFPSWEKRLENYDQDTIDGISELVLNVFSHYLEAEFEDESEILDYILGPGRAQFREGVDKHQLFVPPGAEKAPAFGRAVEEYRNYIKIWRSSDWVGLADSVPEETLVFNGILERITPQFHLRDNAHTMQAHPLFWLPQHFHYFRLISQAGNEELNESGLIKSKTLTSLQSLLHPNVAWLGDVPMKQLVRFRRENRNEDFRRRLSSYLNELSSAELGDIDRVAAEVTRGIASLLVQHDLEAKRIDEEYRRKHTTTLGLSLLTAGASMYTWLAPMLGLSAALAPMLKLGSDVYEEYYANQKLNRSLAGVLSQASKRTRPK